MEYNFDDTNKIDAKTINAIEKGDIFNGIKVERTYLLAHPNTPPLYYCFDLENGEKYKYHYIDKNILEREE